jgi:hypothetical protein
VLEDLFKGPAGRHPGHVQYVLRWRPVAIQSVFALGIMPYISASIIMQLMTVVSPTLAAAEEGRRGWTSARLLKYTRYGTVVWQLSRRIGISIALESQANLVIDPGFTVPNYRGCVTGEPGPCS